MRAEAEARPAPRFGWGRTQVIALKGPFFWLCAFYVVYCARPEDWIPGLASIPLAKITGLIAFIGLLTSLGQAKRGFKDMPSESTFLLVMIAILYVSALLSPVWRGGAFSHTTDFAKVYVVWVLTFMLLTEISRMRRLIFIQSASVAVICMVSMIKGHSQPRLEGVIGGIYSNPNDLAFAIVLSLPFCLAFLLTTQGGLKKLGWIFSMLAMLTALFLTASRGGFITLVVSGLVILWHFGVKGKRRYLIVASVLIGSALLGVTGRPLVQRMIAVSGVQTQEDASAVASYEQRKFLMSKALEGIAKYPILGMGVGNFQIFSTAWRDVHMTYLQIAVEGGIPSLVLYVLFFASGFRNLRILRRRTKTLDAESSLFAAALHSSLIGFVVGACFAPEAYQFFPYFTVAYTSALLAMVREQDEAASPVSNPLKQSQSHSEAYARSGVLSPVR